MPDLDLRPLSLGEILDRTFSLYRRNFVLFLGITALPHLLILGMNLAQTLLTKAPAIGTPPLAAKIPTASSGLMAFGIVGALVGIIVYLVVYLFSQGGTVYAVSELYLGRSTTIGASLGRMRGQVGNLLGVTMLSGLAMMGGFILLIIPGIYIACRLITAVPAALLEDLGPRAALERSFKLTKDSAGRAFVIYLLYGILIYAAILLFMGPFLFMVGMSVKDPAMWQVWMAVSQVGGFVGNVLVGPIFTIGAAVFYYDLRVRKEAFDLQIMMNPSGNFSPGTAGVPTTLT
jgi:Membrane domain of glycerophosphoryl diester phosphodiesterase